MKIDNYNFVVGRGWSRIERRKEDYTDGDILALAHTR